MTPIKPWLAPLLFMTTGACYLFLPRFALSVNQVCEMLSTGNSRGIMMVLDAAGAYGAVTSVGIGCMAFLLVPLKPAYLLAANNAYFGPSQGIALTTLGVLCAIVVIIMIWHTLWAVLPEPVRALIKHIARHELTIPAILSILMLSRVL